MHELSLPDYINPSQFFNGVQVESLEPLLPSHINSTKFYAGIGSRRTPEDILQLMKVAGKAFANEGWTCRSGGAEGADTAFKQGALESLNTNIVLFEEFSSFQRKTIWYRIPTGIMFDQPKMYINSSSISLHEWQVATNLAQHHHPVWDRLSNRAMALHARNTFQVLGGFEFQNQTTEYFKVIDHDGRIREIPTLHIPPRIYSPQPSSFVLCWTPDGETHFPTQFTGGTGQAIRIANAFNIPVYNLFIASHRRRIEQWLQGLNI